MPVRQQPIPVRIAHHLLLAGQEFFKERGHRLMQYLEGVPETIPGTGDRLPSEVLLPAQAVLAHIGARAVPPETPRQRRPAAAVPILPQADARDAHTFATWAAVMRGAGLYYAPPALVERWDTASPPLVPTDRIRLPHPCTLLAMGDPGEPHVMGFSQDVLPRQVRGALWDGRTTWAPFVFLPLAEPDLAAAAQAGLALSQFPADAYFASERLVARMTRLALGALTYLTLFPHAIHPLTTIAWRLWIPKRPGARGVNEEAQLPVFGVG
jgi:hypothetical protein